MKYASVGKRKNSCFFEPGQSIICGNNINKKSGNEAGFFVCKYAQVLIISTLNFLKHYDAIMAAEAEGIAHSYINLMIDGLMRYDM